ncbi:hypothetical protein GCM10025876_32150 [Demequina litorisediminis]|uniref:Uncharacterized protein n=1 Tax=Demequina litorisediminis TaxID=1849022 RepID=A0ABQ6IHZ0_9MICO|nr:hypothetical protein GCM10025876_32150 [Demequina litorisediminis]
MALRMSAACFIRLLVDAQAAGGVDDDDAVLTLFGLLEALLRHLDGVALDALALTGDARLGSEHGHARALADHLKPG